jgi:hypothetical protein
MSGPFESFCGAADPSATVLVQRFWQRRSLASSGYSWPAAAKTNVSDDIDGAPPQETMRVDRYSLNRREITTDTLISRLYGESVSNLFIDAQAIACT